jgi:hypothetical protein
VVELGRRRLAEEQMELLLAQAQPFDVLGELRAREPLHPEDVDVEAKRLLHVIGMDADVVET